MFPLNRQKTILDPTLPDVIIELDILLFISNPTPDQLSFFGGFSECIMSFWLSLQEWVSVRHKMSLSSFSAMSFFICDNPWQFQVPNLRVQASEMCFWLDKMAMIRRNKWGNGIIPVIGRFCAGSLFAESRVLVVFVCVCVCVDEGVDGEVDWTLVLFVCFVFVFAACILREVTDEQFRWAPNHWNDGRASYYNLNLD